jgi:hypothetical protein
MSTVEYAEPYKTRLSVTVNRWVEWVVNMVKKILQLKRAKYLTNPQLAERSTNTDMFRYFVEETRQNLKVLYVKPDRGGQPPPMSCTLDCECNTTNLNSSRLPWTFRMSGYSPVIWAQSVKKRSILIKNERNFYLNNVNAWSLKIFIFQAQ